MSKQGHSQEQIDRKLIRIQSYVEAEERYQEQVQQINDRINPTKNLSQCDMDRYDRNKSILLNDIKICKLQRVILENELMIDKLRKDNYKIKTQHDNEVTI